VPDELWTVSETITTSLLGTDVSPRLRLDHQESVRPWTEGHGISHYSFTRRVEREF